MKTAVARRVRWTVRDYFRMADAGVFGDRRVELIRGDVVEADAQDHSHRVAVTTLCYLLLDAFGPSDWVVIKGTLRLTKFTAPDPDFHVFDVPVGTPDKLLPIPLLVIEISDTTYRKDAGPKLRAYARAGVPDYWIVNNPADRIEVYRHPENPTGRPGGWRYGDVTFFARGETVALLRRPAVAFAADAILP